MLREVVRTSHQPFKDYLVGLHGDSVRFSKDVALSDFTENTCYPVLRNGAVAAVFGIAKLAAIPVFLASVYGGYFGGGLATIVLAVLALEVHESITKLNALKQMISLCANVAAALLFLFSNRVIWSAAIVMAAGALLGGVIGGFAADRIQPSVLRGIVVVFAVAIAIAYFVQ
jgi:uncharacterized membrane protein YfcA